MNTPTKPYVIRLRDYVESTLGMLTCIDAKHVVRKINDDIKSSDVESITVSLTGYNRWTRSFLNAVVDEFYKQFEWTGRPSYHLQFTHELIGSLAILGSMQMPQPQTLHANILSVIKEDMEDLWCEDIPVYFCVGEHHLSIHPVLIVDDDIGEMACAYANSVVFQGNEGLDVVIVPDVVLFHKGELYSYLTVQNLVYEKHMTEHHKLLLRWFQSILKHLELTEEHFKIKSTNVPPDSATIAQERI